MKKFLLSSIFLFTCVFISVSAPVSGKSLDELQRRFVDLRFGMFIHFNMPTFVNEDWPDPDASPELFNPGKLDCRSWAKAAKSAGMTYGCLTTKHHSGFCIWNTRTTDYSVMSSPLKRDVVKEYVDAFRAEGLDVMLYYSILDTHAHLRPGWITPEHKELVKSQLRELLTGYGPITALIIDGWDAPWSRISYDEIPFEEIYTLIKSLQPNCLVMDLNAAKYPSDALFYTDIKSYEQGAGQKIDKASNALPALSCYPLQKNWFWKTTFPTATLKSTDFLVNENIVPMGKAHCNFILNVAPNRDGQIDDNALKALKQIGKAWNEAEPGAAKKAAKAISADYTGGDDRFSECAAPIISSNIAKHRRSDSSWSYDMEISEFANDDDFRSAWVANALGPDQPWLETYLDKEVPLNMLVITEEDGSEIRKYSISFRKDGQWKEFVTVNADASGAEASPARKDVRISKSGRVSIIRFEENYADAVRIDVLEHRKTTAPDGIYKSGSTVGISEIGVYRERRN